MSTKPLPGFRDFYPEQLAERAHVMRTWREIARRYAFVEYDGPPLEPLDLYTKKSGDEIVGQLYNFVDKGDRAVAMRPEMTPTFARMVAAKANALRKPVRWFSMPQLFRYERQQRGRLREHYQLNVDIVGEADVTADAELLSVAIDIMRAFGLTPLDVRARVSDRRTLAALVRHLGIAADQAPLVFQAVDKVERETREQFARRLSEGGVSEVAIDRLYELVTGKSDEVLARLRSYMDPELEECADRLDRYFALLESLGVREWVDFDLRIVRGLAYYTGIVFELFDAKGEFRAICGGGRYDNLLQALGGVDLPALGFGMGDVVLAELLRDRGLMPAYAPALEYWVAADEPELQPLVLKTATLLRRAGYGVEYALRPQQLGKQLKAAMSAGAHAAVILRKQQLAEGGTVTVRRFADGAEETLAMREWIDRATGPAPGSNGAATGAANGRPR